ncbi:MAG: histidine ammonia-lyase [Bacteroidetes bacterium OLB11]|nr:MAG: histidine ammonia-lyase [Bacteroidetes bacterium OLB11]
MKIEITGGDLKLREFYQIIYENAEVVLNKNGLNEIDKCYKFLREYSEKKLIYGINTGFGPMAQYRIKNEDRLSLQFNLIRSHASGCGEVLRPDFLKATLVARLSSLMKARSGIHRNTVELIRDFVNHNILPVIFTHGGVGASGDLVQLAHLALCLIGEGEVIYQSKQQNTKTVLQKLKIKPLEVHIREGLSLMNGTSCMTGIGMINIVMSYRLAKWEMLMSAMVNEISEAYDDHISKELNQVKPHSGQQQVATALRKILKGSKLLKNRHEHLYDKEVLADVLDEKVQEYYSSRCLPQIIGPIWETISHAEKILTEEINSVNDNPVIDYQNGNIFHGGNFHGDYVSLEMDKLKIAITKLSMLAERQLNYLLNHNLNQKLAPFINLGKLGLNFGLQGMQYTATSTVAENQTLSNPMYIHSIPNNNDNQDIVSMGANSALLCNKVIENSFDVLAVHLIAICQAVDYRGIQNKLAPITKSVYDTVRKLCPKFVLEDKARYPELAKIRQYISETDLY